ncbi:MAG: cobalt/nickel transport system permease protein [Candidatus Magnetoglobus multicellularis str. Araruama]|uniref:Cobalt/nickel transport system permease protein n=1 Tax=Candidatus Magnetoglobus multicellularis str. Araruama TaxID=890399 RepID=A0A1V1NWI1_9BACT|nr:MAG: cobalt/nickel transport system permease protein [Candidatus Magnetoglobus multicellularis str. Araruama]
MIKEPFAIGNSWIHKIDPRVKVIFATIYAYVIALSNRFPVLLTALLISILLVWFAHLDLREVIGRLAVVFLFLLLIWVILPFTFEGETLYQFRQLKITLPGVAFSARITLKTMAILLSFMALISTMTIATLGNTLNSLGLSNKLVLLFLMTYRYIFVIEEEYRRLRTAVKLRGFRPGTNIHSYKTFAYIIGMLFVRASIRAERVHQAMRCRGFKGKFYTLNDFSSAGQDRLFSVLFTSITIGLIMLEYY